MDDFIEKRIREARDRASASPDGFVRSPQAEERINAICRTVLTGPAGEALMDYIRAITVNMVLPPSASDAELRSMEGMRRLAGILDRRRHATPPKGD